MALYIGTKKVQLHFGISEAGNPRENIHKLLLGTYTFQGDKLYVKDDTDNENYLVLKDVNGVYITVRKENN